MSSHTWLSYVGSGDKCTPLCLCSKHCRTCSGYRYEQGIPGTFYSRKIVTGEQGNTYAYVHTKHKECKEKCVWHLKLWSWGWYYHISNASIREAKAGPSLWFRGQSSLCNELQASQSYMVKPCLKKEKGCGERGHVSCISCLIIIGSLWFPYFGWLWSFLLPTRKWL